MTSAMSGMGLSSTYTTTTAHVDTQSEDGGVYLPGHMGGFMGSDIGTFHKDIRASRGSEYPSNLPSSSSIYASPANPELTFSEITRPRPSPRTPPPTDRQSRWPKLKASPKAPVALPKKSGPGYQTPPRKAWRGLSDSEESGSSDESDLE